MKKWKEYTLYPGGITFPSASDARSALVAERRFTAGAYVTTPSGKRLKVASPRKNNPAMRKGKTGRWLKAKAVKVIRKNGKLTVMVKR